MRDFDTGATRDSADWKFDLKGFLSARTVQLLGAYMHFHRKQADGKLRASDNWKLGIPIPVYEESLTRHFFEWLGALERQKEYPESPKFDNGSIVAALGMLFNLQGWLHEQARRMENSGVDFRKLIEQQAAEVKAEDERLKAGAATKPMTAMDRLATLAQPGGPWVPTGPIQSGFTDRT